MARAGLGIALVPDFLIRRDIENGALAYFDRHRMPSQRSYHLCFKHARGQEPGMRALVQWFKGELTASPVLKFTTRPK
jgi:LysR family transcriptional regulator, glycine cleavage system transcriptional activator